MHKNLSTKLYKQLSAPNYISNYQHQLSSTKQSSTQSSAIFTASTQAALRRKRQTVALFLALWFKLQQYAAPNSNCLSSQLYKRGENVHNGRAKEQVAASRLRDRLFNVQHINSMYINHNYRLIQQPQHSWQHSRVSFIQHKWKSLQNFPLTLQH